jgi:hypothetical protein
MHAFGTTKSLLYNQEFLYHIFVHYYDNFHCYVSVLVLHYLLNFLIFLLYFNLNFILYC